MSSLRCALRRWRGTWMGSAPRARVGRRRKGRASARGAMVEGREKGRLDLSNRNNGKERSGVVVALPLVSTRRKESSCAAQVTSSISSSSIGQHSCRSAACVLCGCPQHPVAVHRSVIFSNNTQLTIANSNSVRSMPLTYSNLHRDSRPTLITRLSLYSFFRYWYPNCCSLS